eukprot:8134844-Pyramimonas_sp.AAC.1
MPSSSLLGTSLGALEPSWGHPGPSWAPVAAILRLPWAGLGPVFGPLRALLGTSWGLGALGEP